MLQRLIHRTPSPVHPIPPDKHLFNKEGKLRDHVLLICQTLKIDPNDLYPKSLEDFVDPEVHKNIQILRYNHYESKRQSKISHVKSKMSRKTLQKEKLHSLQTSPTRTNKQPSLPSTPLGLPFVGTDTIRMPDSSTFEKPSSFFFTDHLINKNAKIMPYNAPVIDSEGKGDRKMTTKVTVGSLQNIGSKVKMIKSASMKNLDEEEHSSVKAELAKDFEIALQRRMREDERMVNVVKVRSQQEEEYRERMKEVRERREEKSQGVRDKVEKKRQIKIQQLDLSQKVSERREEIEQQDIETRQERYVQMIHRLEDHERKRLNLSTERAKRIINMNETYQQRQTSCLEYKLKMENVGIPDLSAIEERLSTSALRRKFSNFSHKSRKGLCLPGDSLERIQRVRDEDEANKQRIIQKIAVKIVKERDFESNRSQQYSDIKQHSPTTERQVEHAKRLEEIRADEEMRDMKFLEDLKEKDMKAVGRVRRNKSNVEDYVTERRELWAHKIENIKNIKLWIEEEKDKKMEIVKATYKDKIEQILRERQEMKIRLGQAREKSRRMFAL